ncbi:hypothetical protein GGI23_004869, partial [Coemansia sp. RSA 2559]
MVEENVARVWIETDEAATSALNNLGNSELFYGTSLEYVVDTSNSTSENAPIEVVVTGKRDDHGGDNDYVHMISDDSDSDSSMVSVDMLRPPDPLTAFAMSMSKTRSLNNSPGHDTPNSTESGESSAQIISQPRKGNVARKSTGRRHPAPKSWSTISKGQSSSIHGGSKNERNHSSVERLTSTDGPRKRDSSYSGSEYGSSDANSLVTDFMKMEPWRAKAPFIYNFLYRQLPGASAIEDGRHCLSMAWSPGSDDDTLDLYISQGNQPAVNTIRTWGKDYNSNATSLSEIAMTSFQLPARGEMANICSLLNAFNSKEADTMHKHRQRDGNEFAVSTLKLYDQGRILFGCGTNSILVWDTNGIKHKESLMILSDVDGVYDVGRDYVVANSTKGEMCVWKSGARNYMWRYNDTRKFKARPGSDANETPIITALQVDPGDKGAFVGDMSGYVSYGDFRSPRIYRLSPNLCAGVPRSFANAGQHGLL